MQLEYDTDDLLGNREIQPKSPGIAPRTIPGCLPAGFDCHAGDRYQRKGVDLMESALRNAIAFHKSLPDSQRAEEFAKEYAQLTEKFQLRWKAK